MASQAISIKPEVVLNEKGKPQEFDNFSQPHSICSLYVEFYLIHWTWLQLD